jgi:hypothetical protein
VFEIDFDVLELTQNVLAKNAVDLSMHRVSDALHILYENAIVLPNYRSGDQRRFSQRPSPTNPVPFLGGSARRRLIGSRPDASGLNVRQSTRDVFLRSIRAKPEVPFLSA